MRAGAGFNSTVVAAAPLAGGQLHSGWHSPVPYLFGGLAAMLGLIAFALLILACSYWKLSGYLERGDSEREGGDAESAAAAKLPPSFEGGFVVIMAGDVKPTFLAMPISSRAPSFGGDNNNSSGSSSSFNKDDVGNEKMNGLDGEKKPDGGLDGDARVSIQIQNQEQ